MHSSDHPQENAEPFQSENPYHPPNSEAEIDPQTGEAPLDESIRMYAMLCHLSALAGLLLPMGNALGPLVVWLIKRREHPFIDRQGLESLNFQISIVILLAIISFTSLFWFFLFPAIVLLTAPCIFLVGIYSVVMAVIAAVKANQGIEYEYPFKFELVKPDTFSNL